MKKSCKSGWPVVAICYDFDKTLSREDMQNFSLIPKLGLDKGAFWSEANRYAKENGMDRMLSYMKLILEKAAAARVKISESDFKAMGKDVELFDGLETWFERINAFCDSVKVNVEHYVISAGLKEIIEGTKIGGKFDEIFASSFVYTTYGEPVWPRQVVNYTTKTQYLFRINKNCMDLSDEETINRYKPNEQRRIPYRNFIYLGDSDTDIPAMRVVKREGGHAIGVYNPVDKNIGKVCDLMEQDRINFFAPADYSAGSRLEMLVKQIIDQIKANADFNSLNARLKDINEIQRDMAYDLSTIRDYCSYIQQMIINDKRENVLKSRDYINNYTDSFKKKFISDYSDACDITDFLAQIDALKEALRSAINEKIKL